MSDDLIVYEKQSEVPAEFKDVLIESSQDNLKGVTPRLPKIQLPTGKGKEFSLERPGEEELQTKELNSIILYQSAANAYWKEPYGGSGTSVIPDCASHDGIRPSPQYPNLQSENCASCQHNRFGTAKDPQGNKLPGKACRNVKRVILRLNDNPEIPYMLVIPPSSIRKFDDYMIKLRKDERPYWSVGTKLFIRTETNKQGIDYPEVNYELIGFVNKKETLEKLIAFKTEWTELILSTQFTESDIHTEPASSPEILRAQSPTDDEPPF